MTAVGERMRPSRRGILAVTALGGAGLVGLRLGLPVWLRPGPPRALEGELAAWVAQCLAGLDLARVWDLHVHVVGLGAGGTGCEVGPAMRSHWRPLHRLQFDLYRAAAGIGDEATADRDYVERLLALHRLANPAGKLLAFAFDHRVRPDGTVDRDGTPFHTPDSWVLELARRHPEIVPCISVHPHRTDALARLEAGAAAGARAVKWLPAAMGIDPSDAAHEPYYAKLVELGLVLVSHGGRELAVATGSEQELGNPLRLRRALDAGVRVVVAHCAGLGDGLDLDRSGDREVPCFDLFLRLLGESGYAGRLWGDVSAMTAINRCGRPLRELLAAPELHPRLVNGSDYPLPAVDPLFSTRRLASLGYLTPEERRLANGVFDANPLLFDLVVKRCLRVESGGRRVGFGREVFETARLFD